MFEDIRFALALIYEPIFTKNTSLVFPNVVFSWKNICVLYSDIYIIIFSKD
jgi:hypothetical protein